MTVLKQPPRRYIAPSAPLTQIPTVKFLMDELRKISIAINGNADEITALDEGKEDIP